MVDKTALGQTGVPFVMELERGKIAEFAESLQCKLPEYVGDGDVIVPPTYLTSMFFWERRTPGADPWDAVQMSQERGMHAEQEFVFHGPPPQAGTRLTCTSRIAEVYEKTSRRGDRLEFAIKVTEFRDEKGVLVAEARMTGVERFAAEELT